MNMVQIAYFFELAELGSFRKTAEKLYVSQPAVSKQISLLENEWGFPLFERGYRTASLTPAGRIMLNALKEQEQKYRLALSAAKKESHRIKASLTVGIPDHCEMGNFVDVVEEYQRVHPEIMVSLQYAPLAHLVPNASDGGFDVVVNYERNVINNSALLLRQIARRKHVVVVSKHHPLVMQGASCLEDFKEERLYVPSPTGSDTTVDYATFICANHGFRPTNIVVLPNIDSVLLALKMSFGIAVLDDLVALPEWFDLIRIPTNVEFDVLLATVKDKRKACVDDFLDCVSENLVFGESL